MYFLFPVALVMVPGMNMTVDPVETARFCTGGLVNLGNNQSPVAAPTAAIALSSSRMAPTTATFAKTSAIEVERAEDGLFYVEGLINGMPVRFIVDTGASIMVLTPHDADRVGATRITGAPLIQTDTATGKSAMTEVTLRSVQVGATASISVAAAVAQEGLAVSLLGQSWLSRLGSVTIRGDRMTLE